MHVWWGMLFSWALYWKIWWLAFWKGNSWSSEAHISNTSSFQKPCIWNEEVQLVLCVPNDTPNLGKGCKQRCDWVLHQSLMIPKMSDCRWVAVAYKVLESVQKSFSYSCRGSSKQYVLIYKYFVLCSSLDVSCQLRRFCQFPSKQYSSVA